MANLSVNFVNKNLVLDVGCLRGSVIKVWVCDMLGHELYSYLGFTKHSSLPLNVELNRGSYLINVSLGTKIYTEKISVI